MEKGASDYTQPDHASAAHYPPHPAHQHPESRQNYSTPTSTNPSTPTAAELHHPQQAPPPQQAGPHHPHAHYNHPGAARGSVSAVPEYLQRQYHPASPHGGSGGMAQPTNPAIATSSPQYPPHGAQYAPYPPQPQDMSHGYPGQHPGGPMYTQPRPDWAGYGHQPQHGLPVGYASSNPQTPTSASSSGRPGHQPQVYSFVPIPGAQQHKRPRRRYEEIERMYKCGWNGCEKAYGTLNHLNAHVTMQSHGTKRTPEEFKDIRKEWKARKKEEGDLRKEEETRARGTPSESQTPDGSASQGYQQSGGRQLPPIGYQPGSQVPPQYQEAPNGGVQQLQQYQGNHMQQYPGYPASPYGAPPGMYQQRE